MDDAMATGTLWKRWSEIVGTDVAAHAQPTSLRGGVLRVRADSPVWAHEIGYLVDEIRTRANASLGMEAVLEVRVYNAPTTEAPPIRLTEEGAPPAGPETSDEPPPEAPEEALRRAREAWRRRVSEGDDDGR